MIIQKRDWRWLVERMGSPDDLFPVAYEEVELEGDEAKNLYDQGIVDESGALKADAHALLEAVMHPDKFCSIQIQTLMGSYEAFSFVQKDVLALMLMGPEKTHVFPAAELQLFFSFLVEEYYQGFADHQELRVAGTRAQFTVLLALLDLARHNLWRNRINLLDQNDETKKLPMTIISAENLKKQFTHQLMNDDLLFFLREGFPFMDPIIQETMTLERIEKSLSHWEENGLLEKTDEGQYGIRFDLILLAEELQLVHRHIYVNQIGNGRDPSFESMIILQGGATSVAIVGTQDGFCLQTVTGDDVSNLLLAALLFENLWPKETNEATEEAASSAQETATEQEKVTVQEMASGQETAPAGATTYENKPVAPQETNTQQVQRFCGHCGALVENNEMRFCPKCGQPLN